MFVRIGDMKVNRRHWKFRLISALGLLTAYVMIYAILSAIGGYKVRHSGELRYAATGLGVMDTTIWYPAGVEWYRRKTIDGKYVIDSNPLGWLFLPALLVDRNLVHPTIKHSGTNR